MADTETNTTAGEDNTLEVVEKEDPVVEEAVEETTAEEKVEEPEEEEDAPLEDWTKKELVLECKSLGLSDKGTKPILITRIKEARAATAAAPAEAVAEEAAVVEDNNSEKEATTEEEDTTLVEEPAVENDAVVEEKTVEEGKVEVEEETGPTEEPIVAEEAAPLEEPAEEEALTVVENPEDSAEEADVPLEDWTKKDLIQECKTLGLSEKGAKPVLIARIKENLAAAALAASEEKTLETTETLPEATEDVPVEGTTDLAEATETTESNTTVENGNDEDMDISTMVENVEKIKSSRKRVKVSQSKRASQCNTQSRPKRTRTK